MEQSVKLTLTTWYYRTLTLWGFPAHVRAFPQELGEKWAIRRVLQAVVESGQFDVAKALVESSMQHEEGMSEEGGHGEWASGRASSAAEVRSDEEEEETTGLA